MKTFNLSGIAQDDEEAGAFSYQRLLDIAAELRVEAQVSKQSEEAEEILEFLDPPPAWEIEHVDSVLGDFILKIETAPDRMGLGVTIYFESRERAYVIDQEAAMDQLMKDVAVDIVLDTGGDEDNITDF